MIGRCGLLPPPPRPLMRSARRRAAAQPLGIGKIEASANGGVVEFASQTSVDPLTIVDLVQHDPRRYRLDGGTRLRFIEATEGVEARIACVEQLLARLLTPRAGATPPASQSRKASARRAGR